MLGFYWRLIRYVTRLMNCINIPLFYWRIGRRSQKDRVTPESPQPPLHTHTASRWKRVNEIISFYCRSLIFSLVGSAVWPGRLLSSTSRKFSQMQVDRERKWQKKNKVKVSAARSMKQKKEYNSRNVVHSLCGMKQGCDGFYKIDTHAAVVLCIIFTIRWFHANSALLLLLLWTKMVGGNDLI